MTAWTSKGISGSRGGHFDSHAPPGNVGADMSECILGMARRLGGDAASKALLACSTARDTLSNTRGRCECGYPSDRSIGPVQLGTHMGREVVKWEDETSEWDCRRRASAHMYIGANPGRVSERNLGYGRLPDRRSLPSLDCYGWTLLTFPNRFPLSGQILDSVLLFSPRQSPQFL
jgi:hypothetical protein